MKIRYGLVLLALLIAATSFGQREPEYFVTLGGNIRLPAYNGVAYGVYPIIWYNKDPDKKFMVGGLSAGLSYFKPISEKLDLKATINFSRQAYWNEKTNFNKGPNPQDALGSAYSKTTEYYLAPGGVVHYVGKSGFSIGAGFGLEVLLVSKKSFPGWNQKNGFTDGPRLKNKEFKPIMPVVPIEISWKGNKMLYNIRGEAGLLNRYKKDLSEFGGNFFGVVSFEVGMKIK